MTAASRAADGALGPASEAPMTHAGQNSREGCPPPIVDCAVSLAFLLEFARHVPEGYTTADVVYRLVKPQTLKDRCRYVALPSVPSAAVGRAQHFISHRWGADFVRELVAVVADRFAEVVVEVEVEASETATLQNGGGHDGGVGSGGGGGGSGGSAGGGVSRGVGVAEVTLAHDGAMHAVASGSAVSAPGSVGSGLLVAAGTGPRRVPSRSRRDSGTGSGGGGGVGGAVGGTVVQGLLYPSAPYVPPPPSIVGAPACASSAPTRALHASQHVSSQPSHQQPPLMSHPSSIRQNSSRLRAGRDRDVAPRVSGSGGGGGGSLGGGFGGSFGGGGGGGERTSWTGSVTGRHRDDGANGGVGGGSARPTLAAALPGAAGDGNDAYDFYALPGGGGGHAGGSFSGSLNPVHSRPPPPPSASSSSQLLGQQQPGQYAPPLPAPQLSMTSRNSRPSFSLGGSAGGSFTRLAASLGLSLPPRSPSPQPALAAAAAVAGGAAATSTLAAAAAGPGRPCSGASAATTAACHTATDAGAASRSISSGSSNASTAVAAAGGDGGHGGTVSAGVSGNGYHPSVNLTIEGLPWEGVRTEPIAHHSICSEADAQHGSSRAAAATAARGGAVGVSGSSAGGGCSAAASANGAIAHTVSAHNAAHNAAHTNAAHSNAAAAAAGASAASNAARVDSMLARFKGREHVLADTRVWLDIFAINQHPDTTQADDLAKLQDVVGAAEDTLLILDPEGAVLTRIWCLYEVWQTVRHKGPTALHVLAGGVVSADLYGVWEELDVERAQATVDSDRVGILADIRASPGGSTQLNAHIRRAVVESATLDLSLTRGQAHRSLAHGGAAFRAAHLLRASGGAAAEALAAAREAADVYSECCGAGSLAALESLRLVAGCHKDMDCLSQAVGLLEQQVIPLLDSAYEPGDLNKYDAVSDLADCQFVLGQYEAARVALLRVLRHDLQALHAAAPHATPAHLYHALPAAPVALTAGSGAHAVGHEQGHGGAGGDAMSEEQLSAVLAGLKSLAGDAAAEAGAGDGAEDAVTGGSGGSGGGGGGGLRLAAGGVAGAVALTLHRLAMVQVERASRWGQAGEGSALRRTARELLQAALALFEAFGRSGLQARRAMEARSVLAHLMMAGGSPEAAQYAEGVLRTNLRLTERRYGPDHTHTATALNNLAMCLKQQRPRLPERLVEAEALYRRCLALCGAVLGEAHLETLAVATNLGVLLADLRKYSESERLLTRAVAVLPYSLEPTHPDVLRAHRRLAEVLGIRGKWFEAQAMFQLTLQYAESVPLEGRDHEMVLECRERLADVNGMLERAAAGGQDNSCCVVS